MSRRKIADDKEKRRLVEEWDASGQSAVDFGVRRGILPETLQRWGRVIRGPLRRGSQTRPVARSLELVEVPRTSVGETNKDARIEIVLTNGRRLVAFGAWTAELLVALATSLEARR